MEREFQTSVTKVAGNRSFEDQQAALSDMQRDFYDQESGFARLEPHLTEEHKTQEEVGAINLANSYTNQILERLGLPELDIPPKNIHVVDELEQLGKEEGKKAGGYYEQTNQAIVLQRSYMISYFTHRVVHEFIHFKSHNSIKFNEDNYIEPYRTGFSIESRDKTKLSILDEAVTEKLAMEFFQRYKNEPLFKEELINAREYISDLNEYEETEKFTNQDIFIHEELDEDGETINEMVASYAYPQEREILDLLITKLKQANPDKFKTEKQVFNKFVEGMFTGHIYELGKTIDNTFGKGTFRTIGEIDDPDELLSFIKTLQ